MVLNKLTSYISNLGSRISSYINGNGNGRYIESQGVPADGENYTDAFRKKKVLQEARPTSGVPLQVRTIDDVVNNVKLLTLTNRALHLYLNTKGNLGRELGDLPTEENRKVLLGIVSELENDLKSRLDLYANDGRYIADDKEVVNLSVRIRAINDYLKEKTPEKIEEEYAPQKELHLTLKQLERTYESNKSKLDIKTFVAQYSKLANKIATNPEKTLWSILFYPKQEKGLREMKRFLEKNRELLKHESIVSAYSNLLRAVAKNLPFEALDYVDDSINKIPELLNHSDFKLAGVYTIKQRNKIPWYKIAWPNSSR